MQARPNNPANPVPGTGKQALKTALRALLRTTVCASACATIATPSYARAETANGASYKFHITGQTLPQALRNYAQVSGQEIIFTENLFEGTRPVTLKDDYTATDALDRLLEGTGLEYERSPSGAIMIRRAGESRTSNTTFLNTLSTSQEREGAQAGKGDDPCAAGMGNSSSGASGCRQRIRLAQNNPSDNPVGPSSTKDKSVTLEEIVVTAQKRQQNLQDVPISISALGGGRIEELGLQNLSDLMGQVPGVSFTAVGAGEGNLVIRGIASSDIRATVTNRSETVGVYVNDTPIGLPRYNPDISPFDLERVEVLRGPQGTLYGSGSLAGTVRYITRRPDTQEFQSKLGADASVTKRGGLNHRVDAMVNIPLADTLALRVVGYNAFDDGYIRGVGPANAGRDANDLRRYGGRAALRWQVNNDLAADANVTIQRLRSDLTPQDNVGYAYSRGVSIGPYEQYRYSPTFQNNDFNLYNLTLEYALGWGKLTSSTSYLRDDVDNAVDFNGGIQQFFRFDTHAVAFNPSSRKDVSEELRLATDLDGPLNFVGGVFYIHSDRENYNHLLAPGFDAAIGVDSPALGAPVDNAFVQTVEIGERQTALFGELTYAVTQKLSATAGLRWFDVNQNYFISTGGVVANRNPPLDRVYAEHGFNPKFLVAYKVAENVLLSAQAARGFRLGGTNDLIPQTLCGADLAALGLAKGPETFDSENVWNYELNAKTSWDDRRVIVNGSLYYIDYKNIQVNTSLPCRFVFTYNAAAATSKGAELELTARPVQGLEITLGAAYTNAQLSVDVPLLRGKAGDQLPLSAKFTANATARYDFPIHATLRGFAQYSYKYTDGILFALGYQSNQGTSDTAQPPAPAYRLHNIRLGLVERGWEASLYLNNVLDEEVVTYNYNFFGEHLRSLGQPRTGGLSVSYHW